MASAEVSDDDLAKAVLWTQMLRQVRISSRQADIKRVAQQMNVSVRTVRRRWLRFLDNPIPAMQLDSPPGPTPGTSRLSPTVESLIDNATQEIYGRSERPKVRDVWLHVVQLCRSAGCECPGYKAVSTRVRKNTDASLRRRRYGLADEEARFKPAITGIRPERALEVVQIDHAVADVNVVHPENRQPIGRPHLTLAIDVYSRCVVGFHLGFETPDQTAVGLCLSHACNPKDEWLSSIGSQATYPMFGLMQSVHWDNAKTFQSRGVRRQCQRYGIEVNARPVRKPHYGAYIERYIGTLMQALHLLPGTTFSNTNERKDYPSEDRAILTLKELELWIVEEIAKYHHTEHRGLAGATPAWMWNEYWKDPNGRVRIPPLVGNPRDFYIGFLPSEERRVQTDGVSLKALRYWDPALTPFIGSGAARRFHFDQRDLSKIYMADDLGFIDVPIVDRSFGAFTAYELKQAKSERRRLGMAHGGMDEVLTSIARQREIEAEAAHKSKAARRSLSKRAPNQNTDSHETGPAIDYERDPVVESFIWGDD